MSGAMKNFLDYFWTEFAGKVFGYLCASHEKGLTVMDQMRTAVRQCYGWSLPYGVAIHGDEDFDAEGNVYHARRRRAASACSRATLPSTARSSREQFARDLAGDAAAHLRGTVQEVRSCQHSAVSCQLKESEPEMALGHAPRAACLKLADC